MIYRDSAVNSPGPMNLRTEMSLRIPASVQQKMGYYVYLYIDPRDGSVFYVGKGKGERALSHLKDTAECEKVERIAE